MKEYTFEYTDQKLLIKTLSISIGLFFILIAGCLWLVGHEIALVLGIVASFALPTVYFLTHEKKIRKHGLALIGYGRIVFDVFGTTRIISLSNIARYRISHYHGTRLELALKNGQMVKLASNRNFCDVAQFGLVCQEIEKSICIFNETNGGTESTIN